MKRLCLVPQVRESCGMKEGLTVWLSAETLLDPCTEAARDISSFPVIYYRDAFMQDRFLVFFLLLNWLKCVSASLRNDPSLDAQRSPPDV